MARVSFIIPSRNETYEVAPGVTVLQRMVQDIYEKATGDFDRRRQFRRAIFDHGLG